MRLDRIRKLAGLDTDEVITESLAHYIMTGEVGTLIGILVTDALGLNNPTGTTFKDRTFFLTKFLAGQALRKIKEMNLHRKLMKMQDDADVQEAVNQIVKDGRIQQSTMQKLLRVLNRKMTDEEMENLMAVVNSLATNQQKRLKRTQEKQV